MVYFLATKNFSIVGRLNPLWKILGAKYVWPENKYDCIFKFCLALTNIYVTHSPLRKEDHEWHRKSRNRLKRIAQEKKRKLAVTQARYQVKRKPRISQEFRDTVNFSEDDSQLFRKKEAT